MLKLEKYSIGIGDRFGLQATAQLRACVRAQECGVTVIPVWNKSHREHTIIGSDHAEVRSAAEAAVRQLGWAAAWHVDADHIRLETVDRFLEWSDFFTLDVAESIGKSAPAAELDGFVRRHPELTRVLEIEGLSQPLRLSTDLVRMIAAKYLAAVRDAGAIYRHVRQAKGGDNFITEMSTDEADVPQTPAELLVILAAVADEGIPIQTIAPRFSGRFNKGVDYIGDVAQFEREFSDDVAVVRFAIRQYGLPETLKLSVHSGSDKFSLYPCINRVLRRFDVGVHLKTAGTTWLEEVVGLAEAGGEALEFVKEIYLEAFGRIDELCRPYATVIDIDRGRLPAPDRVRSWTSEQFVRALRHEPTDPEFNPHLRQLMHVGYRLAAERRARYTALVSAHEDVIGRNVTYNIFERHIRPIFIGKG